jgi:undecaprenyl diphosphate synthase
MALAKTKSVFSESFLDPSNIPQHIAVIMDGNRRWAKEHHLPVWEGHRKGAESLKQIVESCGDLGVKVLTAYAFSKENWKRSKEEIEIILHLFDFYLRKERENLYRAGVRFRVIGHPQEMGEKLQAEFKKTEEYTAENSKLLLNLAVNYGGRTEMLDAVKKISQKVKNGELELSQIDENLISDHLYTAGVPDPDLLIRTSGELRISNFLLWQMAYAEFWFTPLLWPDFKKADLVKAIADYQGRSRRLGGS